MMDPGKTLPTTTPLGEIAAASLFRLPGSAPRSTIVAGLPLALERGGVSTNRLVANSIVSTSDETSGATLTNYDAVSGAGTIGDANLTLVNYADIAATFSTELVLNTGLNTILNESGGTLEAKAGGVLEIDSNVHNLDATHSLIVADDGGTVEFVADTVSGGTIELNGSSLATTRARTASTATPTWPGRPRGDQSPPWRSAPLTGRSTPATPPSSA